MRALPSLSEQIAYAEGELERALQLGPKLIATGVQSSEAVERAILLQTAVLASLKRQLRAEEALPADLTKALDLMQGEIARIRTTVVSGALRQADAA